METFPFTDWFSKLFIHTSIVTIEMSAESNSTSDTILIYSLFLFLKIYISALFEYNRGKYYHYARVNQKATPLSPKI